MRRRCLPRSAAGQSPPRFILTFGPAPGPGISSSCVADFHPREKEEKPGLNSPSSLRHACGIWPAIIKQEGRSIVPWWLIAGVAIWLCSGALIPLLWVLSVAMGRWRREPSPEHPAVVQDVAAE